MGCMRLCDNSRRAARRPFRVSAVAALAVVSLLAAGCGDSSTSGTTPSSESTTSTPAEVKPTPLDDAQTVAILTGPNAGGRVSPVAVRLDDQTQIDRFAAQFAHPSLGKRIARAADSAELGSDRALVGAVIAFGCGVPTDVRVSAGGGRVMLRAAPLESSPPECLLPMTTVALVSVPAGLAPPSAE